MKHDTSFIVFQRTDQLVIPTTFEYSNEDQRGGTRVEKKLLFQDRREGSRSKEQFGMGFPRVCLQLTVTNQSLGTPSSLWSLKGRGGMLGD